MFNKYFRSYPWWLQLVLFVLMAFTMVSFGGVLLIAFLPEISGYTVDQLKTAILNESSPFALVKAFLITQGVNSVSLFLIPSLLFSYLTHPDAASYAGLVKPKKTVHLILGALIMLGALPVFQGIESLISHINFSEKIKVEQAANLHAQNALFTMPSFVDFLRLFIVMAIIPAFGEELFFRGVLLRFTKKKSRKMLFPIFFTALMFAFSHANVYGLLPIFISGVILAVLYNWTGSLWPGIIGHMCYNGSQILLTYLGKSNATIRAITSQATYPTYITIAGAVVFAISFYLLYKTRTPLPPGWEDDYSPAERTYLNKQQ